MLIGWSVAGMAATMLLDGDPDASVGLLVRFTIVAIALSVFAGFLYRPLLPVTGPAAAVGPIASIGSMR